MCQHNPYPQIACTVKVLQNEQIAASVFSLTIQKDSIPTPQLGQFFMLKAEPSSVLLARPISVYKCDEKSVTFLILQKGRGTEELCALKPDNEISVIGPSGNTFPLPNEVAPLASLLPHGECRVALVGAGIGVAPIASLALSPLFLNKSCIFDFYASFRSLPYGLDGIEERLRRFVVTTEDGSFGVKGILPAVFKAHDYDLVYACGPTPMLRYVQKEIATANEVRAGFAPILGFLSLEERMACGAGACLGCSIRTTHGNKRCCVDGPIFAAEEVLW